MKISCLPTLYTISETVYIDRTTSALWQSLFLCWSRAAVVYLYVCMREDHLYIELIEQENPHKKKTTLMLLCSPSRTVKRTSDKVEDDCRGEATRGQCPSHHQSISKTLPGGREGEQGPEATVSVYTRKSAGSLASPESHASSTNSPFTLTLQWFIYS